MQVLLRRASSVVMVGEQQMREEEDDACCHDPCPLKESLDFGRPCPRVICHRLAGPEFSSAPLEE